MYDRSKNSDEVNQYICITNFVLMDFLINLKSKFVPS